ncbi:ribonuclease P protein component [Planctomycetes bacterium K23_9]|uniref:Ribonuclease P protein component n=1 Tax=Stieleria marina TaxID=1930275 RepID=A0A517NSH9_9BACT|nr:Ribonuclease P protein component [Planctomycetes bacterium K23_9]
MKQTFSKSQRVVRGDDFTLIIRRGVCVADGVLVMFAVASDPDAGPRLGITIPKKVGNAVCRNQWKRWIRESYRTQQQSVPPGIDIIIRPKKDAKPTWASIKKSVPKLAAKAAKKLARI